MVSAGNGYRPRFRATPPAANPTSTRPQNGDGTCFAWRTSDSRPVPIAERTIQSKARRRMPGSSYWDARV